jgi:S1-C subfamily serine protease
LGDLLGAEHKLGTGVLSAMSGLEGDPRMFQLTVPVQPGNSGGPIVNSRGEVIAMLASTLSVEYLYKTQQHIPQNVNFAIKGDYLAFLLRQAKSDTTSFDLKMPVGSRADQIGVARDAVARITTIK